MNKDIRAFLIAGQVCSGKTSTAKVLEEYTGAIRFTPDEWMLKLFPDHVNCEDFDRIFYKCCEISWGVAERCLSKGLSVILDFGFWKKKDREAYIKLLSELGYNCCSIYVSCEDRVIRERLRKRNKNLPEGVFHISEEAYDYFSPGFEEPSNDEKFLVFDNNPDGNPEDRFQDWLKNFFSAKIALKKF